VVVVLSIRPVPCPLQVFTWGCNDEKALGRPVKEDGEEFVPGLVSALEDQSVAQLSAGDSHMAALLENGDVYAWGVFRVRPEPEIGAVFF